MLRNGELIHQLRQEQQLSILIAEQNLALALGVADRVYVLERGEVAYEGAADQFRQARDLPTPPGYASRPFLASGYGIPETALSAFSL